MYTYYYAGRKVICVSEYNGKKYRGIASCMPEDTFDVEVGEKLAKMRCDLKIARARFRDAETIEGWYKKIFEDVKEDYAKKINASYKANKKLLELYDEYERFITSI